MYTHQRKSVQTRNKNLVNNTLLAIQRKIIKNKNSEENSDDDSYSYESRANLREGLIQREKDINYSYIPHSVIEQGESSRIDKDNLSAMYHAGGTAQLQAVDRAKNTNFLFSMGNKTSDTIQRKEENKTGIPDNLKAGVERQAGLSMNDVNVHYNSDKPEQVGALAYTQGTEIHVGPGQEKHLPHELGHVVQQKEGRVKPTMQLKGININDDTALEREADVIGSKAVNLQEQAQNPTNMMMPRTEQAINPNVMTSHIQKKDKPMAIKVYQRKGGMDSKLWATARGLAGLKETDEAEVSEQKKPLTRIIIELLKASYTENKIGEALVTTRELFTSKERAINLMEHFEKGGSIRAAERAANVVNLSKYIKNNKKTLDNN